MPNGAIEEEFVTRLHAVGEWLRSYGDSIYGTRGGPISPGDWGTTTQKGDKMFVHVLHWDAPLLALPAIQKTITGAHDFSTGSTIEFTQSSNGIVLKVPAENRKQVDRIIVLTEAETK
jgi:alpha-L-fucosidase